MKRDLLIQLTQKRIEELRETLPLREDGTQRYQLFDFCEEVVPDTERQSKHVDILELLLDWGFRLEWKGLKFQPKQRK